MKNNLQERIISWKTIVYRLIIGKLVCDKLRDSSKWYEVSSVYFLKVQLKSS
jgi:hypothetical protein